MYNDIVSRFPHVFYYTIFIDIFRGNGYFDIDNSYTKNTRKKMLPPGDQLWTSNRRDEMNDRPNERTNERMHERTNEWTKGRTNERTNAFN